MTKDEGITTPGHEVATPLAHLPSVRDNLLAYDCIAGNVANRDVDMGQIAMPFYHSNMALEFLAAKFLVRMQIKHSLRCYLKLCSIPEVAATAC